MTKIKIDTVEKNRARQTEIKIDRLNKIEVDTVEYIRYMILKNYKNKK